jgi:phospholipid/cholesterol/gamma-HCH transport system substrate-binding protein
METRANYALIGGVVLATIAAIIGFVLWLGQSQFRQDFKAYDIVFEGPVTLEEGSAVRYIGIKVGEVSWVRIDRADPSKVRARVRIDRETPVRKDSTASIQLAGITGITFIQISAGKEAALESRPGQLVPVIRAERTQLDQIFAGSTQVLGKANQAIERINLILTDENIAAIGATLQNAEKISTQLAAGDGIIGQASQTMTDVSNASLAFEVASKDLQEFGQTADDRIAEFGDNMTLLVGDLRTVAETSNQTVLESRRTIEAVTAAIEGPATGALEDARTTSQDLRILINRLDRLTREIEQDPQGFVVGDATPYEDKRK